MEVRVNKGTSHPIEIISCGTSSCITIEEAEQTIKQLVSAVIAVKNGHSEFEAVMAEYNKENAPTGIEQNAIAYAVGFLQGHNELKCSEILYKYLYRIGALNERQ